jgi:hypothetical protein
MFAGSIIDTPDSTSSTEASTPDTPTAFTTPEEKSAQLKATEAKLTTKQQWKIFQNVYQSNKKHAYDQAEIERIISSPSFEDKFNYIKAVIKLITGLPDVIKHLKEIDAASSKEENIKYLQLFYEEFINAANSPEMGADDLVDVCTKFFEQMSRDERTSIMKKLVLIDVNTTANAEILVNGVADNLIHNTAKATFTNHPESYRPSAAVLAVYTQENDQILPDY